MKPAPHAVESVGADPRRARSACPACGNKASPPFLEIKDFPIEACRLWTSREAARRAPRGNLRLHACPACGFIYNSAFDPDRIAYGPGYENALEGSAFFRDYAQALARRLVERYGLRKKLILEVGCGSGEFLRLLCGLGDNRGIGFDPAAPVEGSEDGRITFRREPFTEAHIGIKPDFICARHVLEHIARPEAWLKRLHSAFQGEKGKALYCEVPNAEPILHGNGFWDLIYEHCGYYRRTALGRLFTGTGFLVKENEPAYGGQYLGLEAVPIMRGTEAHRKGPESAPLPPGGIENLARRYRRAVRDWNASLEDFERRRKRVILWGAGAKAVHFALAVKAAAGTRFIVDVNPRKQGCYLPGSGLEIIPPESLREIRPELVAAVNPLYRSEIRAKLLDMGLTTPVAPI